MSRTAKMMRGVLSAVALLLASQAAPAQVALQVERVAGGTAAASANAIFDTIVYSAGNVSYNSVTGVITFNESGRYIINWWVAYQLVDADNPVAVLAISSSQGDFLEGNSVSPSGQVVGMGIVDVVSAPVTVSLVNASTGTLHYASTVPLKATLIVAEQPPPAPPT